MKKHTVMIVVLFLLFSCNDNKSKFFNDVIIKKLSQGNYKFPSKYGSLSLFVISNNQNIIETNSDNLNLVYTSFYTKNYKNYSLFLDSVLNKRIEIPKNKFSKTSYKSFKLDKNIYDIYMKDGFDIFYKKFVMHSKKNNNEYKLNINNIRNVELETVIYILFLNGYSVVFDDVSVKYYVFKTTFYFTDK